ncbi:maspardin-like [Acanthaster planci]|uniref:Maspardin-like n=1 Tax=Acanthaster planci TaxID=133434 RepID=A0A8B7Y357_ACAPL|nr:maspardin-like [Acanthaster planci]
MTSLIARSQEYLSFRSTVSLRKVAVDDDDSKYWTVYDVGPRCVKCPVIFFPPVSGTADIFFRQMLGLSAKGYRTISLEYPVHWTLEGLCISFRKLLDHMQLDMVHIFGSSLGGFVAQKFAEYSYRSPRVISLILCNTFIDTEVFQQTGAAPTFWMIPGFLLKRMVLNNFSRQQHDMDIANSIDFIVERLESLSQSDLASRLTINCMSSYVEPQKLHALDITLIDVFDECAISQLVREETYKCYPDAKRAHLKSGGNFPYLSRSDEVNLHIQIHLLKYVQSRYDARSPQEEITISSVTKETGSNGDSRKDVEDNGESAEEVGGHGDSTREATDPFGLKPEVSSTEKYSSDNKEEGL